MTDGWIRPEENLLSGFTNLYNPHVIHDPENDWPFRMYFFGWADGDNNPGYPGSDAIFLARAQDIDGPWGVYGGADRWLGDDAAAEWEPVMTANHSFYDNWHNGDPSVVKRNGTYYMALSATGFVDDTGPPDDATGHKSCVLAAESNDGVHWRKADEPILISKPEREPDDYDHDYYVGIFHRPSLLYDEGRWRCWFDYKPGGGRGAEPGPRGVSR